MSSGREQVGTAGTGPCTNIDVDAALADRRVPRYSIGQASELLGVAPWFIRRLDKLGIVTPSRSGGAQRRYSREQLGELADAKALMNDGVSTTGVRRVLELQSRVAQLQARVAQLEDELAWANARLRRKRRTMPPEPA